MFYDKNYNFNADVWSLGIVFLELLWGRRITELVDGIKPPGEREDFPSEGLLRRIEDEDVRNLVRRMLERDPKKRLKSKEVLEGLNKKVNSNQNKHTRVD